MESKKVHIYVIDENGRREEIIDFYWFEEHGIHNFNGEGHGETFTFELECDGSSEIIKLCGDKMDDKCV